MAPKGEEIVIRYAEMNGEPVEKKIPAGASLSALAEELDVRVSDLFVNGKKVTGDYKLKSNDFVVLVTNVKGGN